MREALKQGSFAYELNSTMYIEQMSFMLWQVNVHSKSGDR